MQQQFLSNAVTKINKTGILIIASKGIIGEYGRVGSDLCQGF
jgi:hypothetical protein